MTAAPPERINAVIAHNPARWSVRASSPTTSIAGPSLAAKMVPGPSEWPCPPLVNGCLADERGPATTAHLGTRAETRVQAPPNALNSALCVWSKINFALQAT
jgi:hypothetical protein